ncbi:hypothetical protein H257_14704 [Aphanomyces astaci]|uniref:Uncharacterized protein n=1 Tax=Aphanomyces astaci TaxID=112090 RepID=W4FQ26_APHAT|nr:hypothetical protein H257_14704 [Aphanomyces astaci]ETV69572.1 hypothetical protein H257_14704 [Aphanomyces astaci]|eukprot:XP_009840899.1 hypothetical protein H257_14704 [Aphanomyces astaci]
MTKTPTRQTMSSSCQESWRVSWCRLDLRVFYSDDQHQLGFVVAAYAAVAGDVAREHARREHKRLVDFSAPLLLIVRLLDVTIRDAAGMLRPGQVDKHDGKTRSLTSSI